MENKRTIEEIIPLVSSMKASVKKIIEKKIEEILNICYTYSYMGKSFRFDKDKDLDTQINNILIELSNMAYQEFINYSKQAISMWEREEDEDKIFLYLFGENGDNVLARIDQHSSNLKYILEGVLAVGFANNISKSSLFSTTISNLENITAWDKMKEAYKDKEYEADIIKARGIIFGQGINRDTTKAISLIGTEAITGSFDYAEQLYYEDDGATGWTTERGSNYNCQVCDDMVGVIHPMTEIFTGWHSRCMCIFVPVYE